jgi:hypothetical protein
MMGQFNKTRLLLSLSPVADFEYLSEAVVGGGFPRFQKVWGDFHTYQSQFEAWFKAADAKDSDSPHWYGQTMDVSMTQLPVAFETVPQFAEKTMSFHERFRAAVPFLIRGICMTIFVFSVTYALFRRYDVR